MTNIDQRCPSRQDLASHGLWSLWDMLGQWGFELAANMRQIHNLLVATANTLRTNPQATVRLGPPESDEIALCVHQISSVANRLGLQATEIRAGQLIASYTVYTLPLANFRSDIEHLQLQIENDLRRRQFLPLSDDLSKLWEKKDAFGLGTKFPEAHADIEAASSCLAVGLGTACVLHLDRAMEAALKKLAKSLKVTIGPRDTWGGILGNMTPKIAAMPENTVRLKSKKQRWSEARTHLFHIKECWRDRPMHGHDSYSPARAKEIYEAVKVFMAHLAAL